MLERQDTEDLMTEEDFERELQQQCLDRLRNYLCDHLEPERFFPYLQTKQYLDSDLCEQIRSAGTTRNRVNKMLDVIIKSGPRPLTALTKAIEKCGGCQKFIVDKLNTECNKLRHHPVNIEKLNRIKARAQLRYSHNPPAYTPYPIPYHTIDYPLLPADAMSAFGSYGEWKPSLFTTGSSITDGSKWDGAQSRQQTTGANANNIGATQHTSPKPAATQSQQSEQSEMPASIFQTNDFPGSTTFEQTDTRSSFDIIYPQKDKEQLPDPDYGTDMYEQIVSQQEKEISKYEQSQKKANSMLSTNKKWPRSPRTPSEHDASAVYSRSNSNAPGNLAHSPSETSDKNENAVTTKAPVTQHTSSNEGGSPNLKNFMSCQSCQNGSIQASCFTSSNFGEFTSLLNTGTTDNTDKDCSASPRSRSPVKNILLSPQHIIRKPFSSPLEVIESMESKSVPTISLAEENTSSIVIRHPPTEHEDKSMMHHSEDDESSLEISTDSD